MQHGFLRYNSTKHVEYLMPCPTLELNSGRSKYAKVGRYTYRFQGYKSSILRLLLSDEWQHARLIADSGFTGDDEYGTVKKIKKGLTLWVRGSVVGKTGSELIVDGIQQLALGTLGGGGNIVKTMADVLDYADWVKSATEASGLRDQMTKVKKKPGFLKKRIDHWFNDRIIIDVSPYMTERRTRFQSKTVNTKVKEVDFNTLAAVVAGMP